MSHAVSSKQAQAYLIDPMNAPEPSEETGLNSSFVSTYAPAPSQQQSTSRTPSSPSNNSFRKNSPPHSPPTKTGVQTSVRSSSNSPRERFPAYRAEGFADEPSTHRRSGSGTPPTYTEATSAGASLSQPARRRGSSLKERFPGDDSNKPLDVIRRDSRRAHKPPHLSKKTMPGADSVDRLDPAIGGRAYHHEGPYDATLLSRNRNPKTAPLAALETSNQEALKATPQENIRDAVERHQPLDGVASIPPGVPDQFGRTYEYEEGADLMHEGVTDAGYKRWPGKDYDPGDLSGKGDTFGLDRALRAHTINDNGIELEDRGSAKKDDDRDPIDIAGGGNKYVDLELAHAAQTGDSDARPRRSSSIRDVGGSLKKRIGSLRHRNEE